MGNRSSSDHTQTTRFAVVLERFDHLPAVFTFTKLVKAPIQFALAPSSRSHSSAALNEKTPEVDELEHKDVAIDAIRLIELSERTSALIKAAESQETLCAADSLSQIFRTFALGQGIRTTTAVSIVGQDSFSTLVAAHAEEHGADMVLLPWALQTTKVEEGVAASFLPNPFESIFKRGSSSREGSPQYATFVRKVFAEGALSSLCA